MQAVIFDWGAVMDRERIEAHCRVANWATILFGFLALSAPIVLVVETIVWLVDRRWPTIAYLGGWRPGHWFAAFAFLPVSAIVLIVGGAGFFLSLGYWRSQEKLRRRLFVPSAPAA